MIYSSDMISLMEKLIDNCDLPMFMPVEIKEFMENNLDEIDENFPEDENLPHEVLMGNRRVKELLREQHSLLDRKLRAVSLGNKVLSHQKDVLEEARNINPNLKVSADDIMNFLQSNRKSCEKKFKDIEAELIKFKNGTH